uniref:Uncharacterized protein n=1 Tax=Anopheles atroparvus TaxID=41427 RepID=A0AAG5DYS4_ANOAO
MELSNEQHLTLIGQDTSLHQGCHALDAGDLRRRWADRRNGQGPEHEPLGRGDPGRGGAHRRDGPVGEGRRQPAARPGADGDRPLPERSRGGGHEPRAGELSARALSDRGAAVRRVQRHHRQHPCGVEPGRHGDHRWDRLEHAPAQPGRERARVRRLGPHDR